MIWKEPVTIEAIQERCASTLCEHLGMRFTEIGPDYIVATMPVDSRTKQPAGLLHGGASAALAESLGSIASLLAIDSAKKMPVGIELNASHVKAVLSGYVTGKVTPIRKGRTVHVWSIEIRDQRGDLACSAKLTTMIVDRREQ